MDSFAWGLVGGALLGAGQLSGSFPCWVPRLRLGHPLLSALPLLAALGTKAAGTVAAAIDKIEQVVQQQNAIIAASSEEKQDEEPPALIDAAAVAAENEGAEAKAHESPVPASQQEPVRQEQPKDTKDQLEEAEELEATGAEHSNGEAASAADATQPPAAIAAVSSSPLPDSNERALCSNEITSADQVDAPDGSQDQQARSSAIQREVTELLEILERECNSPPPAQEPTEPRPLQDGQPPDAFEQPMEGGAAMSEGEQEAEAEAPQQAPTQERALESMDLDEIENELIGRNSPTLSIGDGEPSAEELAAEAELEEEERLIDEAAPLSSSQAAPTAAKATAAATAAAAAVEVAQKKKKHLSPDQKQAKMWVPPDRARKAKIKRAQLSKKSLMLREHMRLRQAEPPALVQQLSAEEPNSHAPSKRKRQVIVVDADDENEEPSEGEPASASSYPSASTQAASGKNNFESLHGRRRASVPSAASSSFKSQVKENEGDGEEKTAAAGAEVTPPLKKRRLSQQHETSGGIFSSSLSSPATRLQTLLSAGYAAVTSSLQAASAAARQKPTACASIVAPKSARASATMSDDSPVTTDPSRARPHHHAHFYQPASSSFRAVECPYCLNAFRGDQEDLKRHMEIFHQNY